VNTFVENVTKDGFDLVGNTWSDSDWTNLRVGWIASSSPECAVRYPGLQGQWPDNAITLNSPKEHAQDMFREGYRTERVLAGISCIDAQGDKNIRINVATNLTGDRATTTTSSWWDSTTWHVGVNLVGLRLPLS